ncbi:MAG: hypothetical protein RIT24_1108, partial [Planctomycetota bacterium]
SLRNHRRGSPSERKSSSGSIKGLRTQAVPQIPASPASAGTHCTWTRTMRSPIKRSPKAMSARRRSLRNHLIQESKDSEVRGLPRKLLRRFRLRLHLRALVHMDSDDAESDQTESESHECPQTESAEPLDSGVEGFRGAWTPAQAAPQIPASPASAGTRDKRTSEHQRSPPQRRPLNLGDRYSARSNIAAARSSVSSSNAFDWSCSPIGSFFPPSSAKPALMEMPGIPAMFVFTV